MGAKADRIKSATDDDIGNFNDNSMQFVYTTSSTEILSSSSRVDCILQSNVERIPINEKVTMCLRSTSRHPIYPFRI